LAALTGHDHAVSMTAGWEKAIDDPGSAAAFVRSAAQLFHAGKFAAAKEKYERALDAAPDSRQAHAGMYYVLAALGDKHNAAVHLGKALLLHATVALPYRGTGTPVPILVLLSINAGNVLFQRFLNDRIFQTHILFMEFYKEGMPLPPHRLAINAIGDADVRSDALAVAQSVLRHTEAPIINPPAAIRATGRCENAQRLGRIPGVITPLSIPFTRAELAASDCIKMLENHGFHFPLLVRAPGFHMGKHFLRVESAGELDDALAQIPGDELLVIQYLDGRGVDGKVRKYRVLLIDGQFYPVHLAISSHWKIHYFSAEMAESAEHRAEEMEFLNNMAGVLGPHTMAALEQIQAALGLDYAGIDFGMNQKGEVLLFEANATMAVRRPDANSQWDYRRAAIEQIYAAVHRLLIVRTSAATVAMPTQPAPAGIPNHLDS
jgi:glutathione synthase/RimK-type ligase-like ATP-grasp enzyme